MIRDPNLGYVESINKRAGSPFAIRSGSNPEEIDRCPLCNKDVPRASAHFCDRYVLYTIGQLAEISARPKAVP